MNEYTRAEAQNFRAWVETQIDRIDNKIYGRVTDDPISLTDLDTDLQSLLESFSTDYYKKGDAISSSDLPATLASIAYVNGKTRGLLTLVPATDAIDELVAAREGETSLLANLANYSLIADLITNVNGLGSGTIDKERTEPHDHNDLTNRDAEDCHPQSAITDLTDDLGDLAPKATIISVINDSEETEQISGALVDLSTLVHNTLSGRAGEGISDCHSTAVITGLDGILSGLDGRVEDIEEEILAARGGESGLPSLSDVIACFLDTLEAMDAWHVANTAGYTTKLQSCLAVLPGYGA